MDAFVARQPIFDTKGKVAAYELLFRNGFENLFPDIDGDTATSTLLSNTFFSFGIKELLRKKPGFINFTQNLILDKTPLLFPNSHVVVEVLETVEPSPEVFQALEGLKKKGYQIALDDFSFEDRFHPMIGYSDIIKIDFQQYRPREIRDFVRTLDTDAGIPVLLAEKIETHQAFETAKSMGFTLFQGYFFSKPEIFTRSDIQTGHVTKFKLINEVRKTELDLNKIQKMIKNDVATSFKLLKFVNSAYFMRPNPIDTIKDAITYLGTDELRKFITIIAVSDLNTTPYQELLRRSVIRAGMSESIGTVMQTDFTTEELFTLGLFSLMDALLNMEMARILNKVGFSDTMKGALMGKNKGFNLILHIIDSFERGLWDKKIFRAITGKAVAARLPSYYLDAVKMSNALF